VAYAIFPLDSAAPCYRYINKTEENSKIYSLLKYGYTGCKNGTEYLVYKTQFHCSTPTMNPPI